jgi:hypothetical protein
MLSALIATAALVSGFGWYQLADWQNYITQAQSECSKPEQSPVPGCPKESK